MSICAVAVSAATYAIDKLYDYRIPDSLIPAVKVGCRVLVPFGRGNRKVEGMVLVLRPTEYTAQRLKTVIQVLDRTCPKCTANSIGNLDAGTSLLYFF